MNIVFDLDGTLIDSRIRLHTLFQQLAPDSKLSFWDYWTRKRSKVSNEWILAHELGFTPDAIARFVAEWMDLIEAPEFLEKDVCIPGLKDTLTSLREHASLYVCTARQHHERAVAQLESLGLASFFGAILVTAQQHSKYHLIKRHIPEICSHDWIVGDTGRDVEAGKALGINTCAVLSGFQNRNTLQEYSPNLILESASELTLDHIQSIYPRPVTN